MTLNRYMTLLYQAFTKHDITLVMSGDVNQCEPINRVKSIRHNYFKSNSVSEMFPDHIKMTMKQLSEIQKSKTQIPTCWKILQKYLLAQ